LHYFPNFLSRSISVVPWLETKTGNDGCRRLFSTGGRRSSST
jgi:hypothetical protein